MAAISTQALLDSLKNEYFVCSTGKNWTTGVSTAPQDEDGPVDFVKPRIASMSAKLQQDLLDLIDGLDPLVV